ncbi:MAG: SGNH/GDSL hydrolase family protein [Planctomycetota bacterium]
MPAKAKSKRPPTPPRKSARIEDLDPAMRGKAPGAAANAAAAVTWRSYRDPAFAVHGLAWFEQDERCLRRLPGRAEKLVRPPVWDLAQHTSGARIRFQTDSSRLLLRITQPHVEMRNMAPIGHSGIDLFVGPPDRQIYWNVTRPDFDAQRAQRPFEAPLFEDLPATLRECTLYLPPYNRVIDLEIGLDAGARLWPATPYAHEKPIVFYGTSITQSGCSSRPSTGYVPQLSRLLNADVVNLGFSGNGMGEPELATLVAEIDASIFVLDYEANAGLDRMRSNLLPFCETLRRSHPATPLVLVSKICYPTNHRRPGVAADRAAALALYQTVATTIRDRFPGPTLIVDGWSLIGADAPLSFVDESHPTDYGFEQMARGLAPVFAALLPK